MGARRTRSWGLAVSAVVLLTAASCDDPEGPSLGPPTCDDGRLNGLESDVDCGGDECGPCVTGASCRSGLDCINRVCAYGSCLAASCDDRIKNGGESDVDCGGSCPNRCPGGASCDLNSDCSSYICVDEVCLGPSCTDGERNGEESDVDCGGDECDPCPAERRCLMPDDCLSRICSVGVCDEWACDDSVFNGYETDLDCGGEECEPCADGQGCLVDEDCLSQICGVNDRCQVPSCDDEVTNGLESDVDCGGPECVPCTLDDRCNTGADCDTHFCDGDGGRCAHGASCFQLLVSSGELADGVYSVLPDRSGEDLTEVYCDMTTDGGGWTLVSSSLDETVNDEVEGWHEDLLTLYPARGHDGLWGGMREVIGDGRSDIRFSCKGDPTSEAMRVDLSFYQTLWYPTITAGSDEESCFSEGDGEGYERPAPARRDLIGDRFLRRGDDWARGYLEGEDSCDDEEDFTVDFDDRGVGGDESDGTDWGEADGSQKCGFAHLTIGSWFVWVREAAPHCVDGEVSEEETGRDCGGVCQPCPDGQGCSVGGECTSGVCIGEICQRASCFDGVQNGDETGLDCGGPDCLPCG